MPYSNASARNSGTIGSTVNDRRIASLNFVRASLSPNLSPVFSRNSSSREVTKLAVPDAGSRRQSSASRREAISKAPSPISLSTFSRRFDGLRSAGVELEVEFAIEVEIESAFQILDQQTVSGINPSDTPAVERECRHRLPRDNRSQRARVGKRLLQIIHHITNVVQAASFSGKRIHRRLFIGRFHQFPERIARPPALQECDPHPLVGIMENMLIPIRLHHAGEAVHGIRNRSDNKAHVVKRAFG